MILDPDFVERRPIPPPDPENRRIVARIDEQMTLIEAQMRAARELAVVAFERGENLLERFSRAYTESLAAQLEQRLDAVRDPFSQFDEPRADHEAGARDRARNAGLPNA